MKGAGKIIAYNLLKMHHGNYQITPVSEKTCTFTESRFIRGYVSMIDPPSSLHGWSCEVCRIRDFEVCPRSTLPPSKSDLRNGPTIERYSTKRLDFPPNCNIDEIKGFKSKMQISTPDIGNTISAKRADVSCRGFFFATSTLVRSESLERWQMRLTSWIISKTAAQQQLW